MDELAHLAAKYQGITVPALAFAGALLGQRWNAAAAAAAGRAAGLAAVREVLEAIRCPLLRSSAPAPAVVADPEH